MLKQAAPAVGLSPSGRHCCLAFRPSCSPSSSRTAGTVAVPEAASRGATVRARSTNTESKQETAQKAAEMVISGLDTDYCDDFECTSSPAVELTVRTLAKDIQRQKYTLSLLQQDVQYSDGFRSFKGRDKYSRPFWPREGVKDSKARVTNLKMLDRGSAQIEWVLTGNVGVFPVTIGVRSVFEINQLTGRVISHKDSWDLGQLSAPAKAMTTLSRMAWSTRQASQDAQEGIGKATDALSSMASMDDDSSIEFNPNDPTRFFQKPDNGSNDAITLGLLVAVLYLCYKTFAELENLH